MAHLNWKNADIPVSSSAHPIHQTILEISLSPSQIEELLKFLQEANTTQKEFRLDLPQKWTLYWKLKNTGLSRISVATPALGEKVGMLTLNQSHLDTLILMFQAKTPQVTFSKIQELAPFSNLDLCITLR